MKRTNTEQPKSASASLSKQMKAAVKKNKVKTKAPELEGNDEFMISTGSTLLDLAISGGRKRGGGIPAGIFVEIFGPSSSGKTVLLCELAGSVQRQGGEVMFKDPEARLNKQFAEMFGMEIEEKNYDTPDTVPQVFEPVRAWEPKNMDVVNGIFADSLAALSTDAEMEDKDAYGMRRAKEFSEELRKTCRILKQKNFLMVGSNQIRENVDAAQFGEKTSAPGGKALEFYASLRLRFAKATKIKKTKKIKGKDVYKVIGVQSQIEVQKSSVWQPFGTAKVTIIFDYGIDDIRENLQYVKDYTGNTVYQVGETKLDKSMDKSIEMVEEGGEEMIQALREEVIDLWTDIQDKFKTERKPKMRWTK